MGRSMLTQDTFRKTLCKQKRSIKDDFQHVIEQIDGVVLFKIWGRCADGRKVRRECN